MKAKAVETEELSTAEREQKVQENDGETYGGSGYSEKLKDGGESWSVVKEGIKKQLKDLKILVSKEQALYIQSRHKIIYLIKLKQALFQRKNS